MLSVQEALMRIDESLLRLSACQLPLSEALGLRLAQDIVSDVDSPPFDKAMMDGFALRAADVPSIQQLDVIDVLYAGATSSREVGSGQAMQIMTGAPIPAGADCVVRREDVDFVEPGRFVRLNVLPRVGDHIILRGTSMKAGESVLRSGERLNPASIGLLAELGRSHITATRRTEVAILATGDELVDAAAIPGPGQIRNSNEPMLCGCVTASGGIARPLGVSRDDAIQLDRFIADGLRHDILCLSGGVSAGDKDLVPAALKRAGVREVFHKVNLKPGKPLWFGIHDGDGERRCYVFGLPGNPVSSLVCFELFVRHAIERLQGASGEWRVTLPARLSADVRLQSERPVYHPAKLRTLDASQLPMLLPDVEFLNWQGSSDLRGVTAAEGLVLIPAGEGSWPAGHVVEFLPFASHC